MKFTYTDRNTIKGIPEMEKPDICSKCGKKYYDILGIGCCGKCFYGKQNNSQ